MLQAYSGDGRDHAGTRKCPQIGFAIAIHSAPEVRRGSDRFSACK
jgi:hypothetical protein